LTIRTRPLKFYTNVFGFVKKHEIPVGEYKWLTVVAPERDDLELSLEPNANPAGKAFQDAIFKQGIPLAAFEVDDLAAEFRRLKGLGVVFTQEPMQAGPVRIAVCADTCGNLIQLYQPPSP
jgi:predicted enzyme related to lactoylglutathione lyase